VRAKASEGQQVQQRVWLGCQFASSEALDEAYVAPSSAQSANPSVLKPHCRSP
jgi:hypothetical protein